MLRIVRETMFLVYLAVSLFVLLALISHQLEDPGWSHPGSRAFAANGAGQFGAWLSDLLLSLFGVTAYSFPFALAIYGYVIFKNPPALQGPPLDRLLRWAGFILSVLAATAITERFMVRPRLILPEGYGGLLGQEISEGFFVGFGSTGMTILLITLLLGGISLCTGVSWFWVLDAVGRLGLGLLEKINQLAIWVKAKRLRTPSIEEEDAPMEFTDARPFVPQRESAAPVSESRARQSLRGKAKADIEPAAAPVAGPLITSAAAEEPEVIRFAPRKAHTPSAPAEIRLGQLPTLELLNDQAPRVRGYTHAQLEAMSRQLEAILDDFGVEVQVMEVHPGPVITRFEVQPAPGVKVSRISGLAKDLARTLSVTSVRVVEIIAGKTHIGLEIPNEERETVLLHSVLASEAFSGSASPLTVTLGKDISGKPVTANLARMPHLLVAGTTGSGKSVAVNVMILSMLYKAKPSELRMIMIDPKMLELSIYEGIPHLLTPVVTDMKEAANALRWCVAEMERRYKLMSLMGVRNLAGFNQKISDAIDAGEPIRDPLWSPDLLTEFDEAPFLEPLPFIVVVIDELADMMMIVGKKVEELIARLAQKARAAGLHLILATQRPSVDVITGLIKANIPTRIAFQVSSKIDSRTILDQGGAESLLGNGDMLYLPPGTGLPMRAHGAFVSDEDVHKVVEFLKRTGPSNYLLDLTRFSDEGSGGTDFGGYKGAEGGDETDALYDEAVRFVTESRKASISSVQRRFKIGYNRAARMVEDMENAGIVGPAETNGSRTVLAPPPPPL